MLSRKSKSSQVQRKKKVNPICSIWKEKKHGSMGVVSLSVSTERPATRRFFRFDSGFVHAGACASPLYKRRCTPPPRFDISIPSAATHPQIQEKKKSSRDSISSPPPPPPWIGASSPPPARRRCSSSAPRTPPASRPISARWASAAPRRRGRSRRRRGRRSCSRGTRRRTRR